MTEKTAAVTVIEQPQPPAETASFVNMIERLATDPRVDVDKLERLMLLQERIMARNAKAAYNAALADMQPELPVITEKGEIKVGEQVRSKYARWEDIVEQITPILSKHGFALSFRVGRDGDQRLVTGILSHRDGHSEETTLSLPLDMHNSRNAVQSVGSTTSYGKRYVTQALLNLVSRGEDDDGAGGQSDTITAEQKAELIDLLKANGAVDPAGTGTIKFLKFMKVEAMDEIKASDFNKARSALIAARPK